jgi:multiple sugar transport system substrate-binding protein
MTKKLSRRNMLKAGVLATAGAVLASCTAATPEVEQQPSGGEQPVAKPAEKKPYNVILMYNSNEISDDDLASFNADYAPYTVERIDTDLVKLFSMLAAGNQVDVVRLYGTYLPAYVARKVALDLTDYFNTSTITKLDDLVPTNDLFVVNGKRYGMCKDWSPENSIWINKKLWAEAGVDIPTDYTKPIAYQDFRAMSSKLTKREGDRTLSWGTCFTPNEHFLYWLSTTFAQPRHIFNNDFTKIVLREDKEIYEACKFMLDWKKEGGLPSSIHPFASEGGWSGADWVAGQAAAVQWGFWFSGMAESENVSPDDIYPMVAPTYGPTFSNPSCTGCGAIITPATKDTDASWKLFEWFMGELPAQSRAKSGWGMPALKSLLPLVPVDLPWRKQAYDVVQWEMENTYSAIMEFTPYTMPSTFHSAWSKYETEYLQGSITMDAMIESVEREVNVAIQEGMDAVGA